MSGEPELRTAARVLVVDDAARVLLFRYSTPDAGRVFWAPPGGGLEPGESFHAAACRELREETGIERARLGAPVWRREHVFPWGERCIRQRELVFLLRLPPYELPATLAEAHALDRIEAHRWWTTAELEAERVETAPRRLAQLLPELLERGAPAEPLDVGV